MLNYIYFSDLNDEAKERFSFLDENTKNDLTPLAILEDEDFEEF